MSVLTFALAASSVNGVFNVLALFFNGEVSANLSQNDLMKDSYLFLNFPPHHFEKKVSLFSLPRKNAGLILRSS